MCRFDDDGWSVFSFVISWVLIAGCLVAWRDCHRLSHHPENDKEPRHHEIIPSYSDSCLAWNVFASQNTRRRLGVLRQQRRGGTTAGTTETPTMLSCPVLRLPHPRSPPP